MPFLMFLFLAFLLYIVYYLTNKKGKGDGKIKNDVITLRGEISEYLGKFVPWNFEEMQLFSLSETDKTVKKRKGLTVRAVINSIYHEPMCVYVYRDYGSGRDYKILLVQTSNREFVYVIKKDIVNIFMNDTPLASIKENAYLYPPGQNNLLATINLEGGAYLPVTVENRELATLTHPDRTDRLNPRAFEILHKLSEREEDLLLALSFYTIVRKKNKIKL